MLVYLTNFTPTEEYKERYTNLIRKFPGKVWVFDTPMPPDDFKYDYKMATDLGLYSVACTPDVKQAVWKEIISW